MDLITGLKSLWPDFKISVNDLQQPSTQLIVNFVKRSVEELGLNGRIFEHKTEPLNDVMYCFSFINYCFSLSDREIDLTLDSILEPKRTQTKALIGYLYFFILNEREKRSETEKIQNQVDEFVNQMNVLISRRDELKQKKLDQQQFLLDNDKKLIEIDLKKQSILQQIEPLKKSISAVSDRKKKLVDDLNHESEYNSQIMKEKSSLQDKIQMKLDEIVDEKFYAISEKNRDETRENIALIEHDFNEIVANLEQKRSFLKDFEQITVHFENYLKNFNELLKEDFCSISKIEQKCDKDFKLIHDLKENEKKIREQIDKKLTALSQLRLTFEEKERHFIEKKDGLSKQIDSFNSEIAVLKHQIEIYTTKITEQLLERRLVDTADGFLRKYSEDDLSRTLHSLLVDNSDFDNLPNHDFIRKAIECNDLFLNRLANKIDDEKREITSINREFEMIKYAMCKVVDKELSVYPKMGKSLRLDNK